MSNYEKLSLLVASLNLLVSINPADSKEVIF